MPQLLATKMQYTDVAEAVSWQKEREDSSYVTVVHGVKDGECFTSCSLLAADVLC